MTRRGSIRRTGKFPDLSLVPAHRTDGRVSNDSLIHIYKLAYLIAGKPEDDEASIFVLLVQLL